LVFVDLLASHCLTGRVHTCCHRSHLPGVPGQRERGDECTRAPGHA